MRIIFNMANEKDSSKNFEDRIIVQQYKNRLVSLRKARDFSKKDNIPQAVQHYLNYLTALAHYYSVDEKELHPKMFNREKELTELLLISQVYWDLAKAYDRNPKLIGECERCLNQFIKFIFHAKGFFNEKKLWPRRCRISNS